MSRHERLQPTTDLAGDSLDRDTWLTPRYILDALGPFDLDPCAAIRMPWRTADTMYTILDNGLVQPWAGRVWMNPPYGGQVEQWMERLADHGDGIAMVYARVETGAFHPWVWRHAAAVFFFEGRIRFLTIAGQPGTAPTAPSVLVAYGRHNAEAIGKAGFKGKLVLL